MKDIKQYIGTKTAIECKTKEEYDSILALGPYTSTAGYEEGTYYTLNLCDEEFGIGERDTFRDFTIYPASDFIEPKLKKGTVLEILVDSPHGTNFKKGNNCIVERVLSLDVLLKESYFVLPLSKENISWRVVNESEESLINQIKRKYPPGTLFRDLVHNEVFEVVEGWPRVSISSAAIYCPTKPHKLLPNKSARVYLDGVFAEIIETKIVLTEHWCVDRTSGNKDYTKQKEEKKRLLLYKPIIHSKFVPEQAIKLLNRKPIKL